MAPRKKLGYNWKARQRQTKNPSKSLTIQEVPKFEGCADVDERISYPDDTNTLILPSRKRPDLDADVECPPKRKRLSSKQRKRLQKIIESKERKARVSFPIKAHPTWLSLAFCDNYSFAHTNRELLCLTTSLLWLSLSHT